MKIISFFLVLILFISCEEKHNQEEENIYQVISILYQQFAKPIEITFPPPPPDSLNHVFSSKDSARINSMITKIKEERRKKKFIVAVYPYVNSYKGAKDFIKGCSEFNTNKDRLIKIKDSLKIDINKIQTSKKDSIVYFKEELIQKRRKGYEIFDILISFSHIKFNKTYTKASLIGSISTSRLAGTTILYFLEKIDNKWIIKCENGLSIY